MKVLIVDDNSANLYLLKSIMSGQGWEVLEAENGKTALETARLQRPSLIVSDILMPVMDGYEAIRRIKATEAGQNTVIIAETASAFVEDMETILEAGADGYICKPFKMKEILSTMQKLLRQRMQVEEENDDDKS